MSAAAVCLSDTTDPIQIVDRLVGLNTIHEAGVDAVIWRRHVPAGIQSGLAALPGYLTDDGRFIAGVDEIRERVAKSLGGHGLVLDGVRRWLADDVEALVRQFALTVSCVRVAVRVERVRDDACRKFHCDAMTARLICTYAGPGTQIGVAVDAEKPSHFETAPTAMPVLLKGKHWPGEALPGLMHRSPPIEGTGLMRLVIVIDPAQ